MENLSNLFYRSIKKRGEKGRAARLIRFVIGNIGPDIPLQFVVRAKKEKKEETRKFPIYIYMYRKTQSVLGSGEKKKNLKFYWEKELIIDNSCTNV